ncbi:MAG: hypothetical protein STSR0008_06050 [Ignavibacterium sp.]
MKKNKIKNIEEKKTNGVNKSGTSSSNFKIIIGIILIIISVFLFLSIMSFSRLDEALIQKNFSEFVGSFSKTDVEKINSPENWMGIVGAYISFFFVNSVLGYFSLVFPLLLFLFSLLLLKIINTKKILVISNFLIILCLIFTSFFGIIRTEYHWLYDYYELSGGVGEFIGIFLAKMLGGTGGIILLLTILILTIIFTFNINLEQILHSTKESSKKISDSIKLKKENSTKEVSNKNLNKIKELRESNKRKLKSDEITETEETSDYDEVEKSKTNIRIIRKDEIESDKINKEKIKEKISDESLNQKSELLKENDIEALRQQELDLPEPWEENINYTKPSLDLLNEIPPENFKVAEEELKRNAELLKDKLSLFDIQIDDITVTPGPVVTLYEIKPAPGVKISRIVGLENDIALALAAKGIRIIAPIPGKSAIGVEIPNSEPSLVVVKSVLTKINSTKYQLPLALGKDISGEVYITELATMPHLLIAGSTGSGKSVGINMMIASLIYSKHPSEVKFAIIDPKKIELSYYKKLRNHFLAVSPDLDEDIITTPMNAVLLLKSVESEMERRYDQLSKAGVRNIVEYNKKILDPKYAPKDTDKVKHHFLPYLIVIIDELADLMITAGKEVEEPIARLAQLARAVGIHLILATQRPSVNVITGVIKANFSARIAYQVATKIDSRTILDMNGAEQLLGNGDMLFFPSGTPKPIRLQNAFISLEEVEKITDFIHNQPHYSKPYYLPSIYEKKKDNFKNSLSELDPLFEDAARLIVSTQQASVSFLQRRLKLGYSRAARIVDQLEEAGIVGVGDGSKAREIIVENEEQLETILRNL